MTTLTPERRAELKRLRAQKPTPEGWQKMYDAIPSLLLEVERLERERDEEHEAHEQIADHLLPLVGTADGSSVSAAQRAAVEIKHLRKKLESAESALRAQQDAIRWALGELGDFPARQEGQGAYWWRTELRRRAAMPPAPAETGEEK